ncbi:hypothetical protein MPSEU_000175400 [Mayamaea pseudoterrestris]|nr:hypothetical protein MPSEU_000175400 [Mayamaea pseudoterrestris]
MLGRCLWSHGACRVSSLSRRLAVVPVNAPLFLARAMSSSSSAKYLCVHVHVTCKPGTEESFRLATLENARQSALEPGIARFDVLQDATDPTKFCLIEVYQTSSEEGTIENNRAAKAHKETAHYMKWRDVVADMMAAPRTATKFVNHFPATQAGWDYSDEHSLE